MLRSFEKNGCPTLIYFIPDLNISEVTGKRMKMSCNRDLANIKDNYILYIEMLFTMRTGKRKSAKKVSIVDFRFS